MLITKVNNLQLNSNDEVGNLCFILHIDVALFIYTSGTTGLPKPAVIKHSRFFGGGILFFTAARLTEKDVVYISLPIYHANGGIIGAGAALLSGATVVLRKKFSASNFWKDCIKYNCTSFVYIGEICRFLLNQPPSPLDRQHKIRKAIGNGLRINVWKEFYDRFRIKCVEFYAASEGNCTMSKLTTQLPKKLRSGPNCFMIFLFFIFSFQLILPQKSAHADLCL